MAIKSHHLAGYLLSSGTSAFSGRDLARIEALEPADRTTNGWIPYNYVTYDPVVGIPVIQLDPPFKYEIVFRWGRASFLVLSSHHEVVRHFVKAELRSLLNDSLRFNKIRVHELVLHFMGGSRESLENLDNVSSIGDLVDRYTLSYVAANTNAFGDDLRKITFYGERVSTASIFHQSSPLMKFYGCMLRRKEAEILRLGRDGFISFTLPAVSQKSRLNEVNGILRQLTDAGFIT